MNPYRIAFEIQRERLISSRVMGVREDFIGCTADEIAVIEKAFRHRLPAAYRAFLEVMGRRAGTFLRGTDCFHAAVKDPHAMRKSVTGLDDGPALSGTAFVFLSHQGYSFCWFDAAHGDDPFVTGLTEGKTPAPTGHTITQWFGRASEDEISLAQGR